MLALLLTGSQWCIKDRIMSTSIILLDQISSMNVFDKMVFEPCFLIPLLWCEKERGPTFPTRIVQFFEYA